MVRPMASSELFRWFALLVAGLAIAQLLATVPPTGAQEPAPVFLKEPSGSPFGDCGVTLPAPDPLATSGQEVGIEAVERRTAHSKHYPLGGGRFRVHISGKPVHYRDERGRWLEIDTTVRLRPDGGYAVEENGLRSILPAYGGGPVRVEGSVYPVDGSGPVGVALAWVPVAWRYRGAEGNVDDLENASPVAGRVAGSVITYPGTLPDADESYRGMPNGLKHRLTLHAPPRMPSADLVGPVTLDYVVLLDLDVDGVGGLTLWADGAARQADFVTEGPIQVRDGTGHRLLTFSAPVAYEADDPSRWVAGSYAARRLARGWLLAWRTPTGWLLAPDRTYPVVLDPSVTLSEDGADAMIAPGIEYTGNASPLYVGGGSGPIFRSLFTWGCLVDTGLPDYALIDDGINDVRFRLYQAGGYGDDDDPYLALHDVTNSWDDDEVTWYARYRSPTVEWDTLGGDYGDMLALTRVYSATGWVSWSHYALRDEVALERTYVGVDVIGDYGKAPFGYLLKYYDETNDTGRLFYSLEEPGLEPELVIDYQDGPLALSNRTPVERRVPSPDYYSIPSYAYWQAVGIRAENSGTNYDLRLYSNAGFSIELDRSTRAAGHVDFIAVNAEEAGSATRYPLVYSQNGEAGDYHVEYVHDSYIGGVFLGASHGPYTMPTDGVLRLYAIDVEPGYPNCVMVQPAGGDARLGVAAFEPRDLDHHRPRSSALAASVAAGGGDVVTISFVPPAAATYGLAVWNEGSSAETTFYVKGCQSAFLPAVMRNVPAVP